MFHYNKNSVPCTIAHAAGKRYAWICDGIATQAYIYRPCLAHTDPATLSVWRESCGGRRTGNMRGGTADRANLVQYKCCMQLYEVNLLLIMKVQHILLWYISIKVRAHLTTIRCILLWLLSTRTTLSAVCGHTWRQSTHVFFFILLIYRDESAINRQ